MAGKRKLKFKMAVRAIALLVWSGVLTSAGAAAPVSLSGALDRDSIAFDQPLTLTYSIEWPDSLVALSPETAPIPTLKRLRINSLETRTTPFKRDGLSYMRREYIYHLRATSDGAGVVDPLTVGYLTLADSSAASVSAQEFRVAIASPLPVGKTTNKRTLWLWGGALALFVALGAVALWLLKRKPKVSDEPQDELSRRLARLKSLTAQPRQKFYGELFALLRHALIERGLVTAGRSDSAVIVAQLQNAALPDDQRQRLVYWLELSAREKFAPGRGTPGDTLRLYYEVESFINERWLAPAKSESAETISG